VEAALVSVPDDPMERKKWMLNLWQGYGERFAVIHPGEQPFPPTDMWHADMCAPQEPEPYQEGRFDPRVMRHLRWWEDARRFLRERFGLVVSRKYLLGCLAGKRQGRFSNEIDEKEEKRWYVRALRMGAFVLEAKVGVRFRCPSRGFRRIKCSLNLQRKDKKRPTV